MIVRTDPRGGLLLIGQTDHSRFVGQLAAHWGNATFAAPRPYESVVRGATFHDYGWLRYETSPLVRGESGEPYSFLHVPMTTTQLDAYQWALDWMADIDPYAGLVVSMHRTGLWKARYGKIAYPAGRYNPAGLSPEIEAFVARNEAWQERQRARLDATEVWTNYRLMQTWDILGLYFGCQDPYDERIEPVPLGYGGGDHDGVTLTMTPAGPGRVAFDPYPFDVRPCHVQLSVRRVARTSFGDLAAFRRAWFQAEVGLLDFELVA